VPQEIRKFFRPDLLSRSADIVVFGPLLRLGLRRIAPIPLEPLQRLVTDHSALKLNLLSPTRSSASVTSRRSVSAASNGIVRLLHDPLAETLLSGRSGAGQATRITVAANRELKFGG